MRAELHWRVNVGVPWAIQWKYFSYTSKVSLKQAFNLLLLFGLSPHIWNAPSWSIKKSLEKMLLTARVIYQVETDVMMMTLYTLRYSRWCAFFLFQIPMVGIKALHCKSCTSYAKTFDAHFSCVFSDFDQGPWWRGWIDAIHTLECNQHYWAVSRHPCPRGMRHLIFVSFHREPVFIEVRLANRS